MADWVVLRSGGRSDLESMSRRALHLSIALAALPPVAATAFALLLGSAGFLLCSLAALGGICLLVAHLVVSPLAAFVAGLEAVADPAATPAEVLAAMPSEPLGAFTLAAADAGAALHQARLDAGLALQQAASDAAEALQHAAEGTGVILHDLGGRAERARRLTA